MLLYMLDMGQHEQAIARQALQAGQPLPERILNAPELMPGLELYLQAFFDLDSERTLGEVITSIPWTSIASYAKAFELDQEQTEDLFFFVRKLDSVHINRIEARRK